MNDLKIKDVENGKNQSKNVVGLGQRIKRYQRKERYLYLFFFIPDFYDFKTILVCVNFIIRDHLYT